MNRLTRSRRYVRPLIAGTALAAAFSGHCTANSAPTAAPEGILRLIEYTENGSPKECSLPIPGAYADETVEYMLNNKGGGSFEAPGACSTLRPVSIQASNIPSTTKILLTDDWHCSKELGTSYDETDYSSNQNFWIELGATRQPSTLEELGINNLFGYPKKGYIRNKGQGTGRQTEGVKLLDYGRVGGDERVSGHLSCVRITVGAGSTTPAPGARVASKVDANWSPGVREDVDRAFTCTNNTVMAGRQHWGDENGPTHYKCATLLDAKEETPYLRGETMWSADITESGLEKKDWYYFSCPHNSVMIGRHHKWDENGPTRYECAIIYKDAIDKPENRLSVVPGAWSNAIKESDDGVTRKDDTQGPTTLGGDEKKGSTYVCPNNQVMIGRAHVGDENGLTRYRCGTLHDPRTPADRT